MNIPTHDTPTILPSTHLAKALRCLRDFVIEHPYARFHHTVASGMLKIWRLPDLTTEPVFVACGSSEAPWLPELTPLKVCFGKRRPRSPLARLNPGDHYDMHLSSAKSETVEKARNKVFKFARYHRLDGKFTTSFMIHPETHHPILRVTRI